MLVEDLTKFIGFEFSRFDGHIFDRHGGAKANCLGRPKTIGEDGLWYVLQQPLFDFHAPHDTRRNHAANRRQIIFAGVGIKFRQHWLCKSVANNSHIIDFVTCNGLP